MKGKKIAALLMAAVLLMAAMTGCSGSGDKGTLKVATNAEFDPWEYLENGEFVGRGYGHHPGGRGQDGHESGNPEHGV